MMLRLGGRPANGVVGCGDDGHAKARVGQRRGSSLVGADQVPLDYITDGPRTVDQDAGAFTFGGAIARDQVSGAEGYPPDRVPGSIGHHHAAAQVAERGGAGQIGPDQVPPHDVARRPRSRDQDAVVGISRENVPLGEGGPTNSIIRTRDPKTVAIAESHRAGRVGADRIADDRHGVRFDHDAGIREAAEHQSLDHALVASDVEFKADRRWQTAAWLSDKRDQREALIAGSPLAVAVDH